MVVALSWVDLGARSPRHHPKIGQISARYRSDAKNFHNCSWVSPWLGSQTEKTWVNLLIDWLETQNFNSAIFKGSKHPQIINFLESTTKHFFCNSLGQGRWVCLCVCQSEWEVAICYLSRRSLRRLVLWDIWDSPIASSSHCQALLPRHSCVTGEPQPSLEDAIASIAPMSYKYIFMAIF